MKKGRTHARRRGLYQRAWHLDAANDREETAAIKTVFGEHAYKLAISSTKSMSGHMVGAAGGWRSGLLRWRCSDGILPPTINYQHPDPRV